MIMRMNGTIRQLAIALSLLLALPEAATAQAVKVQQKNVNLKPNLVCLLCTLTVTASPTLVNFNLVPKGVAVGSNPVVITTTMTGVSLLNILNLYGYFSLASQALSGGTPTAYIPSSAVLGQMTTGSPTSYTAFTQGSPVAGSSLLLYSTGSLLSIGCIAVGASCRTDSLSLEIDLRSLPQQPAATYTGTLYLQAQAF